MGNKVQLSLLVAFVTIGTTLSSVCPPQEVVDPCMCLEDSDDLKLLCHDEEMPFGDLKRILGTFDTNYTLRLYLYYINLGIVPTDFFKGFNIRVFNYAHCKFDQIPDEQGRVLVGLEDTLESLIVISTIERQNAPVVITVGHLNKLTDLDLSYNTIPEMSDDWFKKGPSSLTDVIIKDNGIEKLGDRAFANLPNLKSLLLNGNQLGAMKRSMLPNPAKYLKDLYLDDNQLKTLPEDFFTGMPSLTTLALQNNGFTTLSQDTFKRVWRQLDYIDLFDNDDMDCEDSALQWMVTSSYTTEIFGGICATPDSRKGEYVFDVIKEIRKGN